MANPSLILALMAEQRQRWEQGDFVRVEDYLAANPSLGEDEDGVLDLICNELALRQELAGANQTSYLRQEFARRFPKYRAQLLAQAEFSDLLHHLAGRGEAEDITEITPAGRPLDGAAAAAAALDIPGYAILGEVGRGGMGVVYKAQQQALNRLVAMKVCGERFSAWPESDALFRQEAQTLAQLQHPAIVPVYDLGRTADGRLFFTMQFVEGESLHAVLERRANCRERLLYFLGMFQAIAEAIAVAHQRGILHRDLKPRNVMVSQGEQVHVVDWGLGKLLPDAVKSGADEAVSFDGGTAEYLSPEQAVGGPGIDKRTDVFGLGAILCEILTGQAPYLGSREQCLEQARKGDVSGAFERLDRCGADPELVRLARRCLARRPEDRPADAAAVAETVRQYLVGLQEKLQGERRLRRLVVALAVAVVLLVVTAGTAWVRRTETETAVRLALQNAEMLREGAE